MTLIECAVALALFLSECAIVMIYVAACMLAGIVLTEKHTPLKWKTIAFVYLFVMVTVFIWYMTNDTQGNTFPFLSPNYFNQAATPEKP